MSSGRDSDQEKVCVEPRPSWGLAALIGFRILRLGWGDTPWQALANSWQTAGSPIPTQGGSQQAGWGHSAPLSTPSALAPSWFTDTDSEWGQPLPQL